MKRYRKPYRVKKRKSLFRNRFFWLVILILVICCGIFYLICFSSFFQIKNIEISGNRKIQTQDLESLINQKINQKLLLFSTRSIFLINSKKIVNSSLEKFPQVEKINLKRKLPATLIAEIKERVPVAIFCQDYNPPTTLPAFGGAPEKCFFLDKFGVIFEESPQSNEIIIKFQDKIEAISFGQKIIKENQLQAILEIQEGLKTDLKIVSKEFVILKEERINVKTAEDWEIYFNLKSNINWQLTKLKLVLEKEIPPEKRGNLEYIDLRFGNLAPYKYRASQPTIEESP